MTETEKKWSERVKEWKSSGQTAKAFAHGRDFKPSTLTYWTHRLRQMGGLSAAAPAEAATTQSAATPQVRMVRVRRRRVRGSGSSRKRAAVGSKPSSATMVIAIGGARIEVRSGFDRALLTEVVEALGGAR
jgi:transposase-like protein